MTKMLNTQGYLTLAPLEGQAVLQLSASGVSEQILDTEAGAHSPWEVPSNAPIGCKTDKLSASGVSEQILDTEAGAHSPWEVPSNAPIGCKTDNNPSAANDQDPDGHLRRTAILSVIPVLRYIRWSWPRAALLMQVSDEFPLLNP